MWTMKMIPMWKNCALSKRRTAHTVAEQKRRDAIKVINVVYLPDFN